MDLVMSAISELFTPLNLVIILAGTIFGIIMGALPGLSSTMAVAIIIPFTFTMEPSTGLILLGTIYCSSVYAGSITAILLNTPGTVASAATVMDGYELTKKGLSGQALGISAIASAIGGIISAILLMIGAPFLAEQALRFGPPEYFALAIFGVAIVSSLAGKNIFKGLMAGAFGILLATVGMDSINGISRYTFSFSGLLDGFSLIPVLIGLFSISQVFVLIEDAKNNNAPPLIKQPSGKTLPSLKDVTRLMGNMIRSGFIGTGVGIIPGAGSDPAAFIAYNEAKRWSKHPEKFGTGILDGVAAPESSNNAVTGGSLIPLLTLGIPGNTTSAVFLGGLLIHGLHPGPRLFETNGVDVYSLFFSLILTNILFLIIGLMGAKYFSKILGIPNMILVPIILILSVVGSFAIHSDSFDIWVALAFGVVGYLFKIIDVPLAPIILGIILGPIAEEGYRQSMLISSGDPTIFFTRPISIIFLSIAFITFITPILKAFRQGRKEIT